LRIAYVTDQLLPRTATDTHQMMAMVSALGEAGARVTLFAPERLGRAAPTREDLGEYYDVRPTFDVVTARSVYPSLRGIEKIAHGFRAARYPDVRKSDVIYTRAIPTVICALVARLPVVYETYRPWPDQRRHLRVLFRWIGRHPTFVGAILHSRLAADSYLRIGVPPEKVLIAHNGHDPRVLEPVLSTREARSYCGLPDGPTVVYTGHVAARKGLGLVLDLAESLPEVTFVLVGSEGSGSVERRAAALRNVRLVAWMSLAESVPYLYAADVLIIPPTSKPLKDVGNTVLPIKTFLYLAAGRAILAPSTPDLLEVLTDGKNAVLVSPDAPQEALLRLRELLGDSGLRASLAAQARADGAMYTWARRAEGILEFLREQLPRTSPPADRPVDGFAR
jgi:glycosyltransferase involved in cell wall biosynthesis